MKKIEGIDLNLALQNATAGILQVQQVEVERKISGILKDLATSDIDIEKAESALKKAKVKREKIVEKIEKIKKGDWNVFSDENQNQKEEQND